MVNDRIKNLTGLNLNYTENLTHSIELVEFLSPKIFRLEKHHVDNMWLCWFDVHFGQGSTPSEAISTAALNVEKFKKESRR